MTGGKGYRELSGPKGRALVSYVKELGEDIAGEQEASVKAQRQTGAGQDQVLIPVSIRNQGRPGRQGVTFGEAQRNGAAVRGVTSGRLIPGAAGPRGLNGGEAAQGDRENQESRENRENRENPQGQESTAGIRRLPSFEELFRNKAPILLEELERAQALKRQKALEEARRAEDVVKEEAKPVETMVVEPVESEIAEAVETVMSEPVEFKTAEPVKADTAGPVADNDGMEAGDELKELIKWCEFERSVDNTPGEWPESNREAQLQLEVFSLDREDNLQLGARDEDNPSPEAPVFKQEYNNQCNYADEPQTKTDRVVELAVQPKQTSLPEITLLAQGRRSGLMPFTDDILEKATLLEETLANFGVRAQVTDFTQGPTITRFEVQPAPGVKVSRIVNLADDIALALAAADVRIEAPIPGKAAVGIEVPNRETVSVSLREVLESKLFAQARSKLSVVLGKDIGGEPVVADLIRMPHLLIAGATGSGKSVCMNSLIISLLYKARPHEVKFLMIDPKMVELSTYNGIPHLIAPVITDPKQATAALRWVVTEMENRYNLFAQTGVKNLEGYNELQKAGQGKVLPLVVVLIDELADLMMVASREVEEAICRLAQMARAAGIHLVIATQRPSVDVITGIIKANIPSRIAFAVSSQVDSRTILDMAGAEKLLGRGDMLFSPIGAPKPVRVQGAFVSDEEVEKVVGFWKAQGKPEYLEGVLRTDTGRAGSVQQEDVDELLPEATKLIIECGQASVSMLQRRFRIGYTRAARLIDLMQEKGFIGGYEGSKPREVLVSKEEWQEIFG